MYDAVVIHIYINTFCGSVCVATLITLIMVVLAIYLYIFSLLHSKVTNTLDSGVSSMELRELEHPLQSHCTN